MTWFGFGSKNGSHCSRTKTAQFITTTAICVWTVKY